MEVAGVTGEGVASESDSESELEQDPDRRLLVGVT